MKYYILISLLIFTGCSNKIEHLEKNTWKFSSGYSIGDFITFNNSSKLTIAEDLLIKRNDTIIAKVIHVSNRNFKIISLKNDTGRYVLFHNFPKK